MELIDLPINLSSWISYWMPWIRNKLNLLDDDEKIIKYWTDRGITNKHPIDIKNILNFDKAICFGSGPNLETHIEQYLDQKSKDHGIIGIDGATRTLIKFNITPNVIVSDLDGINADFINNYIDKHCKIFILAHGDNIDQINKFHNDIELIEKIIWCTQGNPIDRWINTLGFTDGDRGISLCVQNKIDVLSLGFNLNSNFTGKSSKQYLRNNQHKLTEMKRKKLKIATKIITWMSKTNLIYSLNQHFNPGTVTSLEKFLFY